LRRTEPRQKSPPPGDSRIVSDVTASLEQALDRIEAFRAIHEPAGVTKEAVGCLLESVGIDEDGKVLVHDRLFENDEVRDGASTFLGVIIGLLAAELGED
jgi:hypothetical protein